MGKKALAIISFGTTYPQAREAIVCIENRLRQAFPEYDFYRAFTSGMVIRKIEREENIKIPNPAELMEQLAAEGYEEVLCQSLHVIPGVEYEKMLGQLASYRDRFACLRIGRPMLFEASDYEAICKSLLDQIGVLDEDAAYVYMGHGTTHFANAAYSQVENMFRSLGAEHVYVGTVEGFPDLAYVESRLLKRGIKRVTLAPFMIVAGDHAQNDLAGDEDSWKTALKSAGYAVQTELCGLGELDAVGELFVAHCAQAEKIE
ncbi:sirohydrochlorin cobaltochelatase [Butyricicoccus sp. Marseille-Q5471]|uniref:sirohydrochlorin cobaltochelatase n=1 Tax=Butyricicoccus sp. Marseille-Q5471 TaxID=3039493 RepID=UPI0024BD3A95|nr:sirohydrochlorin cobaltochelatase [Butyricicoccus sp. Marseille-Q5471]